MKNHLNIPVVFKSRTTEIVHFIIEYNAGFHAFLRNDGIEKSKFSGNQIFGESEFSMKLSDPFIFEPNQRFTVDVTVTS